MGIKVFTDSSSQFLSRVFQPTASNLLMEPTQTVAASLQMTANQSSASLLNSTVFQTTASNLVTNARNSTSASLLNATVFQTAASNLHVTTTQSTASNFQTTLANRATRDVTSTVAVTTSTTSSLPQQNIITLSNFAVLFKGGTAATNIQIQVSPNGGTLATNWLDNDTISRTLAASTVSILTPTKFSKYVRVQYSQSGTVSSSLSVFYQGQV